MLVLSGGENCSIDGAIHDDRLGSRCGVKFVADVDLQCLHGRSFFSGGDSSFFLGPFAGEGAFDCLWKKKSVKMARHVLVFIDRVGDDNGRVHFTSDLMTQVGNKSCDNRAGKCIILGVAPKHTWSFGVRFIHAVKERGTREGRRVDMHDPLLEINGDS